MVKGILLSLVKGETLVDSEIEPHVSWWSHTEIFETFIDVVPSHGFGKKSS